MSKIKFTKTTRSKLERVLEENGFEIRYEKGNFQSGYCLLKDKKVAVINAFQDTEAKIYTLLELVMSIDLREEKLSDQSKKFLKSMSRTIMSQPDKTE